MDQFTFAERATDWCGNNNIAESIFLQMSLEQYPTPSWIVVSSGTGGTSATIGRFIRYKFHPTRLCVADPEHLIMRGNPLRTVMAGARALDKGSSIRLARGEVRSVGGGWRF
jgi:cysteine synthase